MGLDIRPRLTAYPADEWVFFTFYLTLISEYAPQRRYALPEVLNGARWTVGKVDTG